MSVSGIGVLYFLIIVVANAVGSVSGMGGGVIIKPVLDFVGHDSVVAISFYSTVAVFTMSLVSTIRQVQAGRKIQWQQVAYLALGSVLGGFLGNQTFEFLLQRAEQAGQVTLIQIVVTVALLVFAMIYTRYENFHWSKQGALWYSAIGLSLGFFASLLGIGGGPINVSLLMLVFAMPIKEATVYSIATIFCSQLTKLVTIAWGAGFARYDLSILVYIVPAAIVRGLLGARMSRLLSDQAVRRVFQWVVLLVIGINLYNAFQLWH